MANETSLFHVFLSFRGETRDKFVCFLYKALEAEGFVAFMDKRAVCAGDGVDSTIKDGIKKSMSAIIIFSPNYASSAWCLDELVLILERNRNSKYFIIPIFYEVPVGHIKHQLGNYGPALDHHRARHNDKVDKWREALVEVGDILGHHIEGPHDTFIRKTVKLFGEKFTSKFPECLLPPPNSSYSSSKSSRKPDKDKVILYTISDHDGKYGANNFLKQVMMSGNMAFEERNCSKEPKYINELKELLGYVRFPALIVNGMDLCGVKGLYDYMSKPDQLMLMLKWDGIRECIDKCCEKTKQFLEGSVECIDECCEETGQFLDECCEETGQFLDECCEETGQFLDECCEETEQFLDESGECIEECLDETVEFLDEGTDKVIDMFKDLFGS